MLKKISLFLTIIFFSAFFAANVFAALKFEDARKEFFKKINDGIGEEAGQGNNEQQTVDNPRAEKAALTIGAPNISYKISGKLLNLMWEKISNAEYYEILEKAISSEGAESEIIHNNANNFFTRPQLDNLFGSKLYYKVRTAGLGGKSEWSNEIKVNLILDIDRDLSFGKIPIGREEKKLVEFKEMPEISFSIQKVSGMNDGSFDFGIYDESEKTTLNLPVSISDGGKKMLFSFKPDEMKLYSERIMLYTEAGNFEINLTGNGIPLPEWHDYSGTKTMSYYNKGVLDNKLMDLPNNPLVIAESEKWIYIADNNGGDYVLYLHRHDDKEGEIWQFMPIGVENINGVAAIYEAKNGKIFIGLSQRSEGKIKYKIVSAFAGEEFKLDENFGESDSKIISIFGSNQDGIYILEENALKARNISGEWDTVYKPDEFFDRGFTSYAYDESNSEENLIYLGTVTGSIVKLNESGQYLGRRLNSLNKQEYDSLKELYSNTVRMQNRYNKLYNAALAAQNFAKRFGISQIDARIEPRLENFNEKSERLKKDAELYLQEIIEIENFKNAIKAFKIDSSGRFLVLRNGGLILLTGIEYESIDDIMRLNTKENGRLLFPNTPEHLIEEFLQEGRWTIENIILGEIIGQSDKIVVKGEHVIVLY